MPFLTTTRVPPTHGAADLDDVIEGLRHFLLAEVIPRHVELEASTGGKQRIYAQDGSFTPQVRQLIREVRQLSAKSDYYSMLAPADIGGGGLGYEALYRVWETVYRECGARYWLGYSAVAHWSRGPSHLLALASEAVRNDLLPELLDGSSSLCFAMSEPDAGSDAWQMRTRAQRCDGGWLISGTKQWITNGPYADYVAVIAVDDMERSRARKGGLTAFLTPMDRPGLQVDSVIEMFGHPGGDEAILSFDEVFVPDSHVIGEVGRGMEVAMAGVSTGRLYNTARAVGLAKWGLDLALRYAEERTAFGQPIIEFQGVAFPLAESAMQVHAAQLMGLDCARLLDAGLEARLELSMAKAYATEMATRVIDAAMQTHGAMGFTNEVGLSEAWQQVRRICVADGTAEMMRRQVVGQLRRAGSIR